MARHRVLIESQASLSQIKAFQEARAIEEKRFETALENEDLRRLQAVYTWLKPTPMEKVQFSHTKIRSDYPVTGHWLLDNAKFKEWFDRKFPAIPPLLWLNGNPGTGEFD
jgi:hypothetical protein